MNGVKKRLLTAGLLVATEIGGQAYTYAASGNWDIERINDSVIFFRNGVKLETSLYDVHFIGKLKSRGSSQLLIFSGKDCHDCCAQNAVFLYSPSEKKVIEPEYAPYDYPGTEYSAIDSTVVYKSRMFYGKVLDNVSEGIIWYQQMLGDDGQYMNSAYIVKLDKDKVSEELVFENPPSIEETLSLESAGLCSELQGVDFLAEQEVE
jgi:hypothetical protein